MSCEHCGDCGALLLTEEELALLRRFGQTPFLPAAWAADTKAPAYLEEGTKSAVLGLAGKGLIRLDRDVPLEGFDYAACRDCPVHGSMALTKRGQDVLEQIEILGIEE